MMQAHFGRMLRKVISIIIEKISLEEIVQDLTVSYQRMRDALKSVKSSESLVKVVGDNSAFTNFPVVEGLADVYEVEEAMELISSFKERRAKFYTNLKAKDFIKLSVEAHTSDSHAQVRNNHMF